MISCVINQTAAMDKPELLSLKERSRFAVEDGLLFPPEIGKAKALKFRDALSEFRVNNRKKNSEGRTDEDLQLDDARLKDICLEVKDRLAQRDVLVGIAFPPRDKEEVGQRSPYERCIVVRGRKGELEECQKILRSKYYSTGTREVPIIFRADDSCSFDVVGPEFFHPRRSHRRMPYAGQAEKGEDDIEDENDLLGSVESMRRTYILNRTKTTDA